MQQLYGMFNMLLISLVSNLFIKIAKKFRGIVLEQIMYHQKNNKNTGYFYKKNQNVST